MSCLMGNFSKWLSLPLVCNVGVVMLVVEDSYYLPCAVALFNPTQVEAERFHRTLAEDLEALHKAKMHRK